MPGLSLFLGSLRSCRSLHRSGLSPDWPQTLAALPSSIRIKPEPRSALSLACMDCPVTGVNQGRVNAPGLLLRFTGFGAAGPVRPLLPTLSVMSRLWADLWKEPVACCFADTGSGSPLLNRHSLLGFRPPDQSTRFSVPPDDLPKDSIRFRSLPNRTRTEALILPDHRSRLVSFPPAHRSVNLLEPHSGCTTPPRRSTKNCNCVTVFH